MPDKENILPNSQEESRWPLTGKILHGADMELADEVGEAIELAKQRKVECSNV